MCYEAKFISSQYRALWFAAGLPILAASTDVVPETFKLSALLQKAGLKRGLSGFNPHEY